MRTRLADIRGEKALGLFLDRYFYPGMARGFGFNIKEKKRIRNKAEQIKGIDVQIPIEGELRNIDEKGALRYIGVNLPTFTYEIDFYSDKEGVRDIVDGWFISRSNLTDDYLIMWIKKAKRDSAELGRIMADDFEEVEAYLIRKQDVRRDADGLISIYAEKKGICDLEIEYEIYKSTARYIRENNIKEEVLDKDHTLRYSPDLPEKPVNLKISKNRLSELAYRRYLITKESVKKEDGLWT